MHSCIICNMRGCCRRLSARALLKDLNQNFQNKVKIPRIRIGDKQETETLISEEALLFAMYLRGEKSSCIPRILS